MTKSRRIHYFEITLYIFIAATSIGIPLFIRFDDGIKWSHIVREWTKLIPFFVIFVVNNFIFLPRLLFKARYPAYIASCLLLLILVTFLNNLFFQPNFPPHPESIRNERIFHEQRPQEFNNTPPERVKTKNERKNHPLPPRKIILNFGVFIIGVLIIGFNAGVKIFIQWIKEQDERNEKEKQYLNTELAFLRQQVSPHFFMNTLNNIHALVDIDSERAKDAIIKLSRLMRYLLYETDTEKIALSKEIEFLESYVELMRLRYEEASLSIEIHYTDDDIAPVMIPSLLFLPLIENAFKHGVQNNKSSFVDIQFKVKSNTLIFTIKNSNFPAAKSKFDEASGIGLENIRKRLNLIYKSNYILLVNPEEKIFEVSLAIPIEGAEKEIK